MDHCVKAVENKGGEFLEFLIWNVQQNFSVVKQL